MLVSFKKWLISVFNPPYQLALSDKFFDKKMACMVYVFKQYGSHDYIKVTYFDMLNNPGILSAVNPIHLMDIHLHEHLLKQETEKYHVTETLRNNQYKIANTKTGEIYSGEHICRNVDMFSSISHADLCKIAYQSGFIKGRKTSVEIKNLIEKKEKEAQEKVLSENDSPNVINLTNYRASNHKDN